MHDIPGFLRREQHARFAWWSHKALLIMKGDISVMLDADDLRDLRRFLSMIETADGGVNEHHR